MKHAMKQSGMAMVEALVASALLGLGLLGATRLTLHALDTVLQTRQLVQAQSLAQQTLDCARLRTSPCPAATPVSAQGVDYQIALQSTPLGPALSEVQVQVTWPGRGGAPQELRWRTRLSTLPDALGVSSP